MKTARNVMAVVLLVMILGVSGILTYRVTKVQGIIENYSINDDVHDSRVLIATQKKSFKEKVLKNVESYYKENAVYISVVDITQLAEINHEEWDAIIIFSSIESNGLHKEVEAFITSLKDYSRIYMVNTADRAQWDNQLIDIDSITAPSKRANVEEVGNYIINAIKGLL
ncbi:hypothetical protein [Alkaliphilus serpentinus]|uniref:Uncharacterized protein n=1 Tax=Alkaliphilus serpentinus TaxID=1482731 RepID=A0A833M9J6_9FIRM|nr:hypothetical protein [Alkaliphilus serpentinus]KAB3528845.1 hypothetical protein F8153_11005 [Alkaliphilus serpentinus]